MIDIRKLSSRYEVRRLSVSDADDILRLCQGNPLFYEYGGAAPTKAQILNDLQITPPGTAQADKYYVGYYAEQKLIAVLDLIDGYPEPEMAFLGFFMMEQSLHGRGIGSAIIGELTAYLKAAGKTAIRLAIDKSNPQANRFWKKNGFSVLAEKEMGGWVALVAEKTLTSDPSQQEAYIMDCDPIVIRPEEPSDHRAVENLIRESFWNVYRPGCSEHYVIHVLRTDPAFVRELDFVMEQEGRLIGQNLFMKTVIEADDGRSIPVLTMGPICITPELKRQGYGKKLLDYSLERAAELGFGAVLFEGNIDFYGKSGFAYARRFGIRYHDLPEDADDSFFLCRELIPGYLDGVTGVYQTPRGYYVDDADVEEFDRAFPKKEKLRLPGQIF